MLTLLTPFCDPTRKNLSAPFNCEGHTVATNGKMLVRIPEVPLASQPADHPTTVSHLFPATPPPFEPFNLQLPDPKFVKCKKCDGLGHFHKCGKCHGEGMIECLECGHESQCEHCNGAGRLPVSAADAEQCESCHGTGQTPERQFIQWKYWTLDVEPVRQLLTLPGLMFPATDYGFSGTPVMFRFDGGDGVIAPIRR